MSEREYVRSTEVVIYWSINILFRDICTMAAAEASELSNFGIPDANDVISSILVNSFQVSFVKIVNTFNFVVQIQKK